jgi:cellulose synthase/poly-beta-1,6-N-acetylglucosamine synthase-like glycosyltransferase
MLEKSFSIQGRSVRGQQIEWRSVATSPSSGGATADSKIASDAPDVLPLLSCDDLEDTLRRLPPQTMRRVLRHGVVPVASQPDHVHYAICGPKGEGFATRHGLSVVARIAPSDFHYCVRRAWGRKILARATYGLAITRPQFSARKRVTFGQWAAFLILATCLALSSAYLPASALWIAASAALGLFFLSVIALRLYCLISVPASKSRSLEDPGDANLPIYSVLVPVFRETSVLSQLLHGLSCLNYPVEKLEIKIIVEEFDTSLRRALEKFELPPHIEVIVVPHGSPQTKPRALNYALQFCHGSLTTIYDAEDVPEPNQLREVAREFLRSDKTLACLQAQLTSYNPNENWLTRQFTAEYAMLFGLILPALAARNLPLTLGGTSNHFRTHILRKIGGWDAHNVTEDADLGLRLARLGFRAGVVQSLTHEEANTQLVNWLGQRARWLKGFMQTWLVHMRHPVKTGREVGPSGFWTVQALTAGIFISALFHPFFAGFIVWLLVVDQPQASMATMLLTGLNLEVFVLGYGVAMLAGAKALRQRGLKGWWFTIATMPIYWLLMSAAAWLALWQFIFAPFKWNKTEHGLSKLQA